LKILIDLQANQTVGSASRGIGRYTRDLLAAICADSRGHDIHVLVNGALPGTVEVVRNQLPLSISAGKFHSFHGPVDYGTAPSTRSLSERAGLAREAKIRQIAPDAVLTASHFEGLGDKAVAAPSYGARHWIDATILYDLIPWNFQDVYLQQDSTRSWYIERISKLLRYDLLLSISEASRCDAITMLGCDPNDVVNISGAVGSSFRKLELTKEARSRLKRVFQVPEKFVLYTGGMDFRKNIEGLLRGFSLSGLADEGFQLVVVCSLNSSERERMSELIRASGLELAQVIFTGFVPDDDLVAIYNAASLMVFPSIYEGFGLPVLEAMTCGTPAIGSAVSSIPEIIEDERFLFDPHDPEEIAGAMRRTLTSPALLEDARNLASQQASKFSWARSAEKVLTTLEEKRPDRRSLPGGYQRRPKMAFVSPIPPDQSGIAEYSASLLPHLARYYEIDLYTDARMEGLRLSEFQRKPIQSLRETYGSYDRVVYQIGNSSFHDEMIDLLRDVPGVVVLHDAYLSGLYNWREQGGDPARSFDTAIYRMHGWPPFLSNSLDRWGAIDRYPMTYDVLRYARGLIVHSELAASLAKRVFRESSSAKIRLIGQPRAIARADRASARNRLGLKDGDLVVCSFGHVSTSKLPQLVVEAFKEFANSSNRTCTLVFVGLADPAMDAVLRSIILPAKHCSLKITGFVDNEEYESWLAAADVAVQLRTKSRGETSRAVLDAAAYNLPLVVNAHGTLSEIDEQHVYRVGETPEPIEIAEALSLAIQERGTPQSRSNAARDHLLHKQSPGAGAKSYAEAIEHFYVIDTFQGQSGEGEWAFQVTPQRTVLLDITRWTKEQSAEALVRIRSSVKSWIQVFGDEWRVEPCNVEYMGGEVILSPCTSFISNLLDVPDFTGRTGKELKPSSGDWYIGLAPDYSPRYVGGLERKLALWQAIGVNVAHVPSFPAFPPDAEFPFMHERSMALRLEQSDAVLIPFGMDLTELPNILSRVGRHWANIEPKFFPKAGMPDLLGAESELLAPDILELISAPFLRESTIAEDLILFADDPRLATQVGIRAGGLVSTTNTLGFLTFGPYARLPEGRYRFTIMGCLQAGDEHGARLDVACQNGTETLASAGLIGSETGKQLNIVHSLEFVLSTVQNDIEFRVWVSENTKMAVSSISVELL
jgi:glycosyltransferase involved in cell wall biosynthesis